jgi:hypothetical protein
MKVVVVGTPRRSGETTLTIIYSMKKQYWALLSKVRHVPKNVINNIAIRVLVRKGYSSYMANVLIEDIKWDLLKTKARFLEKIWAYKRGFLSRRINEYGLTESNWKDYETDFHYYKLHPLNEFSKWIDDKLTYKYVFQPFSDYLPKYYYELRHRGLYKLMDCPTELTADVSSVIRLLQQEKQLAIKPLAGTGGQGFYKLSSYDGKFLINDKMVDTVALEKFLSSLNRYIVTEYLISHELIRKIWSGAPNTLRIIMVHNENEKPIIAGAYIRFGTSTTGAVDNVDAGGLACGIDITDGRLYGSKRHQGNAWIETPVHDDTKIRIEGYIPHWDMVIQKLIEICNYVPHLKYMSFDIVITDNGFKVIEINSHGAIYVVQLYYPLLKNKYVANLFYKNKQNYFK